MGMAQGYWLVKQEPKAYSWADLVREGATAWTGVRNFQARNFLRAMRKGDRVFFYHSGEEKQVVGVARVLREAYPDPTAPGEDWASVDLHPEQPLAHPVSLARIKADPVLSRMPWVRQSRLSVCPLTATDAKRLMSIAAKPS